MNIQDLQNEMQNLRISLNSENYEQTRLKMQQIDKQITAIRINELLSGVNNTQNRKRELAKKAYECEQPNEDITTNTGDFHKVKVKKYPVLAALKYTYAKFENGVLYELNINGEKFTMYSKEYNGSKEKPTYTRPQTFNDFLELNNISNEDITLEKFNEISTTIKEANETFRKQVEDYKNTMENMNAYNLECYKLIYRRAEHVYLYQTN